MSELKFRPLTAAEVDCRVAQVNKQYATLLLYKDARCDQNILDETVGAFNWQRKHSRENANCTVSIWDDDKKMWVEKEDTGTESNTEKEKGLASDSFKRACFNWGIGRELYTAPRISIRSGKVNIKQHPKYDDKFVSYDRFTVTKMAVTDGRITELQIRNDDMGLIAFEWKEDKQPEPEMKMIDADTEVIDNRKVAALRKVCGAHVIPESTLAKRYGKEELNQLTLADFMDFKKTGDAFLKEWDESHAGAVA